MEIGKTESPVVHKKIFEQMSEITKNKTYVEIIKNYLHCFDLKHLDVEGNDQCTRNEP